MEMISRAVHRNLLRLLGFCMTLTERLLVYPFMENGSVASCIQGNKENEATLDWTTRWHIALGSAREKTDVYGYGIMLLELITGQRAFDLARLADNDDVMLLDWVKAKLANERIDLLVSPDLKNNYIEEDGTTISNRKLSPKIKQCLCCKIRKTPECCIKSCTQQIRY
ncbi:hypothetical protein SUGI_0736320 [Cryptomeria japonica]|nr:hypothetical protein SUGI_0736320 [Cryptomeria japonica]